MLDTLFKHMFYGGMSPFEKIGVGGAEEVSCSFSQNFNIHEDPSYLTQNPATSKVSGTTVTDLVKWIEDGTPFDTNRYFYDASGKIYKETSGGTWSSIKTVTDGDGQGMIVFDDYLYYASKDTIGRYGKLSGTPSFSDDFLNDGVTNVDQTLDASSSSNTYTLQTSINEGATHKQTFIPTNDPLIGVKVLVVSKGSGDFTLTVHDSNDNSVGSVTVANASVSNGENTFSFSAPIDVIIGQTYHFHLTVSSGTSTVRTTDSSDFETVDYDTLFGILKSDDDYHPMLEHLNGIVIGNGRYVAFWDQAVYDANRLVLAPGFKVRAITKVKEFVAILCWRGNSIDAVEEGRIYYWDGISTTFNFYEDIPMGLPNAAISDSNRLLGVYGSRGALYMGSTPFQKVTELPGLAKDKTIEVLPGAITNWREKTLIGYSGNTTDTNFRQGVYEFGNAGNGLPEAMSMAFTLSTGSTQGTNIKIGALKGIGSDLYIAWKDDSSYGVDKVTVTDNAYSSATYEDLWFDNNAPFKQKTGLVYVVSFLPLTTGQSVTCKYDVDRAGTFTSGTTVNTVGATEARVQINSKRFKDIKVAFDVASSSNTKVYITGTYFEFNDNKEELNYG